MKKISLLIMLLCVLCLWGENQLPDLKITYNNKISKITKIDLKKIPISPLPDLKKEQIAYSVSDLLTFVNIKSNKLKSIEFISSDGLRQLISVDEFEKTYLLVESKKNNIYYRLFIPADPFHQRWIKYVDQLVIK